MAAEVESMFSVRQVPWHGLGTIVEDAPNSEEALKLAGLDWDVIQCPVMNTVSGLLIPNTFSNMRSTDHKDLGIVSDRYKVVQNKDAFQFTDALIGADVRYETAGSLKEGRTVWLLAKMPSTTILNDEVEQYICFSNSHDGTGRIRVCCTPVRVVCNNTLNLALQRAKRSWSMTHAGNIEGKLEEARKTLEMTSSYMTALSDEAEKLASEKLSDAKVESIIKNLFPITPDMKDRARGVAESSIENLLYCYRADDLANFTNTKWGLVNAVSDFVGHTQPARLTDTYRANNWGKIMEGHPLFDQAYQMIKSA